MGKTTTSKALFTSLIIVFIIGLFLPIFSVQGANYESIEFKPNISIPGSEFIAGQEVSVNIENKPILVIRYFQAIYKFFVGIAGIIAVFMIVFGGVIWLFSGGNSEKVGKAKEYITGAIIGLVLAVGSYTILNAINPSLVNFQLNVAPVPGISLPAFWCKDVKLAYDVENIFINIDALVETPTNDDTKCGSTYFVPGDFAQEVTCKGFKDCEDGKICSVILSDDGSPSNNNAPLCKVIKDACEAIWDDNVQQRGLPQSQVACDSVPIGENNGACLWLDFPWHTVFDDQCEYWSQEQLNDKCENVTNCADYKFLPFSGSGASVKREAFCNENTCRISSKCVFISGDCISQ